MARALARFLFNDKDTFVRLEMSEYQTVDSLSRLIGAPNSTSGTLSEALRRCLHGVILFNDIEKAHQDIHKLFFQICDEGAFRDGHGTTLEFRKSVIIATSDFQSEHCGTDRESQNAMWEDIERHLPPLFLYRTYVISFPVKPDIMIVR